jgi:translation initiation factor 1
MKARAGLGGLVYSTEHGRMCPDCGQPIDACHCARVPARAAGDGIVRIRYETSGRRGKGVTVIRGVPLDDAGLAALGKLLRQRSSSGGTVRDGVIEIQGDHVDALMPVLREKGWVVKKNGG